MLKNGLNNLKRNKMKQTAIEWLIEQTRTPEWHSLKRGDIIEQAKEMEKQQQDKNKYSEEEVKHLMTLAFEQGFKKADIVEAGLEAKETDIEVNWIFLKNKK